MKFSMKVLAVLLAVTVLLCGCEAQPVSPNASDPTNGSIPIDVSFAQNDAQMFTDRDRKTEYDAQNAVQITLSGTSASATADGVEISGSTVTINREGTYFITGTLSDGKIVVEAGESDKLQLVFGGVNITSKTSAPLYILNADKVFVTLAEGTENALSSGERFVAVDENNIDGAVFSKQDLTFNGTGSLTITSPAGHGIVCKDDLVFAGGTYTVNAASHGLQANDSVRFTGAAMTIDAGKDGIHTENDEDAEKGFFYMSGGALNIEAEGDGISAAAFAQIEGGAIDILAGGGIENGTKPNSGGYGDFMGGGMGGRPGGRATTQTDDESTSMKGIKATGSMLISSGSITIDSADDTLHTNNAVIISGGNLKLKSGDDGVHADVSLSIADCTMEITECYEGLEAEKIYISGGSIKLKASDDGINAAGGTDSSGGGGRDQMFGGGRPGGMGGSSNGYIEISGGDLYINSSGDGIDANGSFLISGGHTVIVGPTQGDTATLDYDKEGKITGGTFIGTGASGMAQSFSGGEQGVFAVSVGNQAAGTQITLTDSSGKTLISYAPELNFAVVILSCPEMRSGESYTITVGSASGTFEAS